MLRRPAVYIRSNRKNGTLYIGVTADLARRTYQHEVKANPGSFVARYGLNRLVYVEFYDDMTTAITREKKLKDLPRARKVRLIQADNPEWEDLSPHVVDVD